MEFTAYRILYFLHTQDWSGNLVITGAASANDWETETLR